MNESNIEETLCISCKLNTQEFPFIQCKREPLGPSSAYPNIEDLSSEQLKELSSYHHKVCEDYEKQDIT